MPDDKLPEPFPQLKDLIRRGREIEAGLDYARIPWQQQAEQQQQEQPESDAARSLRIWQEFLDESE